MHKKLLYFLKFSKFEKYFARAYTADLVADDRVLQSRRSVRPSSVRCVPWSGTPAFGSDDAKASATLSTSATSTTRGKSSGDPGGLQPACSCYTSVGRHRGRNVVMLEANQFATCTEHDIVIHELMHVSSEGRVDLASSRPSASGTSTCATTATSTSRYTRRTSSPVSACLAHRSYLLLTESAFCVSFIYIFNVTIESLFVPYNMSSSCPLCPNDEPNIPIFFSVPLAIREDLQTGEHHVRRGVRLPQRDALLQGRVRGPARPADHGDAGQEHAGGCGGRGRTPGCRT